MSLSTFRAHHDLILKTINKTWKYSERTNVNDDDDDDGEQFAWLRQLCVSCQKLNQISAANWAVSEWMNERTNECASEWVNECVCCNQMWCDKWKSSMGQFISKVYWKIKQYHLIENHKYTRTRTRTSIVCVWHFLVATCVYRLVCGIEKKSSGNF